MNHTVAISYSITKNYKIIQKYWKAKNSVKNIMTPNVNLGGLLEIGDTKYKYNQPYGFRLLEKGSSDAHVIVSAKDNNIIINGSTVKRSEIFNLSFNDLHDVIKTEKGFLVSSSGLDSIVEVDEKSNVIWSHYFILDDLIKRKNKYLNLGMLKKNEYGYYMPKKDLSNLKIPTSDRAVHPNSIEIQKSIQNTYDKERYLWFTMFYQSAIGRIDRFTNDLSIIFDGLKNPHGIKEHENFWSVVDTRNARVILFDKKSMVIGRPIVAKVIDIKDSIWIQDATLDKDNNIWLINATTSTIDVYSYISGKLMYKEKVDSQRRAQHIELIT